MSIQSVNEIFENRGGSSAGVSAIEQPRIFRVVTYDGTDDFNAILAGYPGNPPGPASLPALYDTLESNDKLTCRRVDGRQEKGNTVWILTYHYSSAPIDRDQMDREKYPDPTDRPARATGKAARYTTIPKSWIPLTSGTETLEEPPSGADAAITTSTDQKPICNSAGDHYDTLVEIDDGRWQFQFSKNYPADELPDWLTEWSPNLVNKAPTYMLGSLCDTRTLKLLEPNFSDVMRENDVDYRTVTFSIDYNALGWCYELIDRGFNVNNAGTLQKIVNGDQTTPSAPVLLNGSGALLSPASGGAINIAAPVSNTTNAVILQGAVYPEEDFTDLPIDESEVPTTIPKGDI